MVFLRNELEQTVDFVAGIDDHALARSRTCDDEAVLVERATACDSIMITP